MESADEALIWKSSWRLCPWLIFPTRFTPSRS